MMKPSLEFITAKDLRNTLKQTGVSLREVSKNVFPEYEEDYLSHKIREGNIKLLDKIWIKEYIDERFGEDMFYLCLTRYKGQEFKMKSYIQGKESKK